MPMEGAMPNYFTINGRAYPATDTIRMNVGETLKVRFIGSNTGFIHPMHIHGGPFEVVARDGEKLAPAAPFKANTINVEPSQRYYLIWTARKAGKWMIHCHSSHHTTNNNTEQHGGGADDAYRGRGRPNPISDSSTTRIAFVRRYWYYFLAATTTVPFMPASKWPATRHP